MIIERNNFLSWEGERGDLVMGWLQNPSLGLTLGCKSAWGWVEELGGDFKVFSLPSIGICYKAIH